jgi:hypothetical protein
MSEQKQRLFDRSKEFVVPIVSGEIKRATVRFPTDTEWSELARKKVQIRRFLGRDKSQLDLGTPERMDADLFNRIRIQAEGDTTTWDEAEASAVIDRLERCEVEEGGVERAGNTFAIAMKVPGAHVIHTLKMPTEKQKLEYGRSAIKITDGKNMRETRVNLDASGRLWDELLVSTEGYSGDVPVIHKDVALVRVLTEVQNLLNEIDPED